MIRQPILIAAGLVAGLLSPCLALAEDKQTQGSAPSLSIVKVTVTREPQQVHNGNFVMAPAHRPGKNGEVEQRYVAKPQLDTYQPVEDSVYLIVETEIRPGEIEELPQESFPVVIDAKGKKYGGYTFFVYYWTASTSVFDEKKDAYNGKFLYAIKKADLKKVMLDFYGKQYPLNKFMK